MAGDALGMRLVQQVVSGDRTDPDSCVHPGNAAMVAQCDQECVHRILRGSGHSELRNVKFFTRIKILA